MYAGECAHISNPMGEFHDKEDGKVRLRILHVDTSAGYVVFGLNSQRSIHSQDLESTKLRSSLKEA